MKTTEHQRFAILIQSLGLTKNSFAIAIKVAPTQIYNICNGRNAPSFEMLKKIGERFPEVNLDYLIVNRGQPIKPQQQVEENEVLKRLELLEATLKPTRQLVEASPSKMLTQRIKKKKKPARVLKSKQE